jgi:hypothetical protein
MSGERDVAIDGIGRAAAGDARDEDLPPGSDDDGPDPERARLRAGAGVRDLPPGGDDGGPWPE